MASADSSGRSSASSESRPAAGIQHVEPDRHDAGLRAALAASMPIGITVGRQILHVSVLAEEDREATVRRAGPALQGGTPIPAVAVRT